MKNKKIEKTWIGYRGTGRFKKIGGSIFVRVPKEYIDAHNLENDSPFAMLANKDLLVVIDKKRKKELYKEITEDIKDYREALKEEINEFRKIEIEKQIKILEKELKKVS